MGKGSKERPLDRKRFRQNWDAIFGDVQGVDFGPGVDSNTPATPSSESDNRQREDEPHGLRS